MKRKSIIPFIAILVCVQASSQGITDAIGARYIALGAYSSANTDVYATRSNAASLAELKQSAVAVYGERRFMLEDLNLYTASVGILTNSGNFAFHGAYLGSSLSNQSQITLSYGRKITSKIDIGGSFHYQQIKQAGIYGSAGAVTGSLGILLHLTDKLHAGINAYNPIRAAYDKDKLERIPSQYNFGLGWDVSDNLYVSAELVKTENRNLDVNAGFQYRFVKQFFIRGGIATLTSNYYIGLGFNLKDFRLDIATSYHPHLGLSPGLLLIYGFGHKKSDSN